MNRCHDCNVYPGELHVPGCDVERCRACGSQAIGCSCAREHFDLDTDTDPTDSQWAEWDQYIESLGGRLPWNGRYPGETECEEFGWYTRHGDVSKGDHYWVSCCADHPDALPDLNRLAQAARGWVAGYRWDVKLGRVVRLEKVSQQ